MAKTNVACPNCRARYSVDDTTIGKKGKCAKCGNAFFLRNDVNGVPPALSPDPSAFSQNDSAQAVAARGGQPSHAPCQAGKRTAWNLVEPTFHHSACPIPRNRIGRNKMFWIARHVNRAPCPSPALSVTRSCTSHR